MPLPVLAIAALASAAIKAGSAYAQNRAAKRTAARLEANRPFLPESTAARDQQALAESELQGEGKMADKYYNETNRNFSNSLNSILKNGGDVNDVGSLFDGSDVGYQRARMMSENLRLNNIQNAVKAWNNSDNARQQQFQFNQWAPYADQAQANARARQQSANNMWSAADSAVGIGLRYGGGSSQLQQDGGYADNSAPMSSAQPQNSWQVPSVSAKYNYIDPNSLNFSSNDTYSFIS